MKDKKIFLNELLKFSEKMPPKPYIDRLTKFKIDVVKNNPSSYVKLALKRHKNKNIKNFLKSYDNVRQCDDRWPRCDSMEDWYNLSKNIKNKCYYTHKFSPEHYIQHSGDKNYFEPTIESLLLNEPDFEPFLFNSTGYGVQSLSRAKNVIYKNLEYINNSNIIEFATGDASLSAAAIHMGATSSVVTDISKHNLKLCEKTKEVMGYNDNILKIYNSDIRNKDEVKNLCKDRDVAVIQNILFLYENKIDILRSITDSKVKYIIISELLDYGYRPEEFIQKEIDEILYSSIPAVYYRMNVNCKKLQALLWSQLYPENYEDVHSNPTINLSLANIPWYDSVFSQMGYKRIKFYRWTCSTVEKKNDERFTAVYKIDNCNKNNK